MKGKIKAERFAGQEGKIFFERKIITTLRARNVL